MNMEISIREKIMLILAASVLIFYFFIYRNNSFKVHENKKNKLTATESLNTFLNRTIQKTSNVQLSEIERYIIDKSEVEWSDPFALKPKSSMKRRAVLPLYSGYVSMGDTRIAVINGMDYGKGDFLVTGDYKLLSIESTHIIIENKLGKRVTVPIINSEK